MNRKRGLGSGLNALIPNTSVSAQAVREIAVTAVRQNRSQPRTLFDEEALEELAASIREHGVIQPIIVTEVEAGAYELVAGERRLRAAQRAGLLHVPALVKQVTPLQLLELALVENVQRADLNPLEEGQAYQTLKDDFGMKDETIAQRVGKSRVAVVNARRLIKLALPVQKALLAGSIRAGHGRALLRIEDHDNQLVALALVMQSDMSVREAERLGDLVQHPALAVPVREALLSGALSLSHIQAVLRITDADQQNEVAQQVLAHRLNIRETEQLCDAVVDGKALVDALGQVRNGSPPTPRSGEQPPVRNAEQAKQRSDAGQAPEDQEARRLFEAALETPVQLARNGTVVKLTITFFNDEQLQQFYDLVANVS